MCCQMFLQATISRPRRTDMLAASHLILVSILAPSWSLSDQDRTNVRPTSVPKLRLCPSAIGGYEVGFPTRCSTSSVHRMGVPASRFSARQSCLPVPSRRHHQTRARGLNLGVAGRRPRNQCICVKGSRSEFLYTRILWFRLPLFLRNLRMTQEDKF